MVTSPILSPLFLGLSSFLRPSSYLSRNLVLHFSSKSHNQPSPHTTMVQSYLSKNVVFSAHIHMRNVAYISFITSNSISGLDNRLSWGTLCCYCQVEESSTNTFGNTRYTLQCYIFGVILIVEVIFINFQFIFDILCCLPF